MSFNLEILDPVNPASYYEGILLSARIGHPEAFAFLVDMALEKCPELNNDGGSFLMAHLPQNCDNEQITGIVVTHANQQLVSQLGFNHAEMLVHLSTILGALGFPFYDEKGLANQLSAGQGNYQGVLDAYEYRGGEYDEGQKSYLTWILNEGGSFGAPPDWGMGEPS